MEFRALGLEDTLLQGLEAMGFETPTPIQEQAIPIILKGQDLIACAQTGTGKTAAFLLPTINKIIRSQSEVTEALILVPTRELAMQIDQALMGFAYFTGTSSTAIYGGRDGKAFDQERKALTTGANIVIATPGRLIAHLNLGYVKFDQLSVLILDEADRMLDMGFVNDIQKISDYLPKKRQNLMFSATMPPKIRSFAKRILYKPQQINIAVSKPAEGVLQTHYKVNDEFKIPLLQHLLTSRKPKPEERILVFASTKNNVRQTTETLKYAGLQVAEIHSDIDQKSREQTMLDFKSGRCPILIATDILSRGIDIKGVDLVINFDVPSDGEDYIHRIGRTARADSTGIAITLVNRKDFSKFRRIEKLIGGRITESVMPEFLRVEQAKKSATLKPNDAKNKRSYHKGGSHKSKSNTRYKRNSNNNKKKRPNNYRKKEV